MKLNDNIDFIGQFSIKAFNKDGSIEVYEDKNLIMDRARQNMAQLVGGVTTEGSAINKFVLGTEGHVGTNILEFKQVGSDGFDSTRTEIFSEENTTEHYVIPFDPLGGFTIQDDVTNSYNSNDIDAKESCTVLRTVSNRTVTYVITIPDASGNAYDTTTSVIAYTEAALYAGNDIFSMKTFPARVKEDTVKFEITWSIIF